jgi:hypothetical protein
MTYVIRDASDVAQGEAWRRSKMGYQFDVNSDIWELDGSVRLNLEWVSNLGESDFPEQLREAMGLYAEEYSGFSLRSIAAELRAYSRMTPALEFSVTRLINFKNSNEGSEHKLSKVRPFLVLWFEWGIPGVSEDVITYLEELTLKGNIKGAAVRSRCPHSGPLTKLEQGALLDWASNAFNSKRLSLREFGFLLALMFTGRRDVQIRGLRACDLVAREDGSGNDYVLRLPRAKQRGGGFRMEFRSMPIEEDLYLLLNTLAERVRESVESEVRGRLPEKLAQELPIFVESSRIEEIADVSVLKDTLENRPDYFHLSRLSGVELMHQIGVKNQAKSERTGDFIHITSRRFRYSKGTNLSNRGIIGSALAFALDHSDTQQVDVYVKNTAATAEYIDEIMAPVLAPLAQAFAGQLVDSERDALRADDPHSRVKNQKANGIGNCGTHAFCASGYRSCYTCTNFQPWRDAPHSEVRDEVLAERNRQQELGVKWLNGCDQPS